MHLRLTALSLAAAASFAPFVAQAGCSGGGSVTSAVSGVQTWGAGDCTISNSGSISGGTPALSINASVGTLTNNGTIAGSEIGLRVVSSADTVTSVINNGTISAVYTYAIQNNGTIGTLTNTGSISANYYGLYNTGTITTLTNEANATISAGTGIYNNGSVGTLSNSGTISGASDGIQNDSGGTIGLLTNSGVITGYNDGLLNLGTITTLVNSGTISDNFVAGIYNGGTIDTLTNSGVISGYVALANLGGHIGALNNSGTISGASFAIYNQSGSTLGIITNSGLISGDIVNYSNVDLTINGGSGPLVGTLTGANGSVGTITNTLSNVVFGSGNLLLNDSINVGSNAVNNNGTAVLQVNQPVTITGNYNQAGGTLQVGVVSSTQAGELVVTGNTTMSSGAVNIVPAGYALAAGQRYVVVDTAGTATYGPALTYSAGTFTATGTSTISSGHDDLVVTLSGVSTPTPPSSSTPVSTPSPTLPALTQNAHSALTGLSHYTGIDNAALLNLYDASLALDQGADGAANRAGKQLNPVSQGSTAQAAAAPTLNVLDIVSTHVNGLRLAQADAQRGVSTGEDVPAWGVWGQAFGGHASQDERDQVDGYSANFGGLLFGVDHIIGDAWRAGGVFSYSNAAINNTGDTAGNTTRVNSYNLTGYASYVAARWYANFSAGAVQQRYDTNRVVDFTGFSGDAGGSFSGTQYVARAEAGYPLAVGSATLTPLASLTYSYLHQNAYTEAGGNGAALSVDAAHATSITSDLGAKISRDFATQYGMVVPELQLAWRHEYDNSRVQTQASFAADPTGATSFTSLGANPITNSAVVSAGVTPLRANNLSLTARYTVQAGSGYVSQAGSLRLRQLF